MRNKVIIILMVLMIICLSGCDTLQKQQVQKQVPTPPQNTQQNNGQLNNQTKQAQDENTLQQPSEKEIISIETPLLDKRSNRLKNLKLAIDEINGKVLEKNQVFSFNQTVGKRTVNRGYQKAIVFIENKKEQEVGGGICQISSTLYAAAKYAGLEILERHKHQMPVNYIKEGDDATVYYDRLDMKFKNTTAYPIRIYMIIGKDSVVVTLNSIFA